MVFSAMSALPLSEYIPGQPGDRFDPYVRLIRSLLPRTSCVAMFGPAGELLWSTETTTGAELMNIVDDALLSTRANPDSAGQMRLLGGNLPVYLWALRDDQRQLLCLLSVVGRPNDAQDKRSPDFAFVGQLLAPAVECLRRELIAQATIDDLTRTVGGLDKDLNLLLTQDHAGLPTAEAGAGDLQQLLQQIIEHLRASTGALLVP